MNQNIMFSFKKMHLKCWLQNVAILFEASVSSKWKMKLYWHSLDDVKPQTMGVCLVTARPLFDSQLLYTDQHRYDSDTQMEI